jgi:hypothetical protein
MAVLTGTRVLTEEERAEAEDRLTSARIAQTAFWRTLRNLEETLGFEVDGTADLEETDIDILLENSIGKGEV